MDKQLELFLLSGAEDCYLVQGGILVYAFNSEALPCLPLEAQILVKILSPYIWFELQTEDKVIQKSEKFDMTSEPINCCKLYEWSQAASDPINY